MTKKFQGRTCVYCARPGSSETSDHVVAREFFPVAKRGGLPKLPACSRCNNAKSKLEHYLTAVLPFGATHGDSGNVLSTMVPRRLTGNVKLAKSLAEKVGWGLVSQDGGRTWVHKMSLPFDGAKLAELFQMMTRGLAFLEFQLLLPEADYVVRADFLTAAGREFFDKSFAGAGNKTGVRSLGDGIYVYEGVQSLESPQLTFWRMSLCGSSLSGPEATGKKVSTAYCLTVPRHMPVATNFVRLMTDQRSPSQRNPAEADSSYVGDGFGGSSSGVTGPAG